MAWVWGRFWPTELARVGKCNMAVRDILLLGNPKLYQVCEPVRQGEVDGLRPAVQDLHDTLMAFRARHGVGRAIAAPQIGVMKRLVYMHIDEPVVFLNPVLDQKSEELMEVWDDCMSFPDLLVRVRRHRQCRIVYRDLAWQKRSMVLDGDLSELLQHECDHLDGVLAVSQAIDGQSFALKSQQALLDQGMPGGWLEPDQPAGSGCGPGRWSPGRFGAGRRAPCGHCDVLPAQPARPAAPTSP